MKATIGTVIEAAEIRATQWRHISKGKTVMEDDVVDELFECEADEARSIAEEQEAAIAAVRSSLPACSSVAPLDTLAVNAMCLWEEALGYTRQGLGDDENLYSWLADGEGAFAARDGCWSLAGLADVGWLHITNNGAGDPPSGLDAFDWDFVPMWLEEIYKIGSALKLKPALLERHHAIEAADAVMARNANG